MISTTIRSTKPQLGGLICVADDDETDDDDEDDYDSKNFDDDDDEDDYDSNNFTDDDDTRLPRYNSLLAMKSLLSSFIHRCFQGRKVS